MNPIGKKNTIIWDLDGTLFSNEHRLHLVPAFELQGHCANWDEFNLACEHDPIIPQTAALYSFLLRNMELQFILLTARSEICRSETLRSLEKNGLECNQLIMRPEDCHESPVEFKKRMLLTRIYLSEVLCAFEDNPEIVAMMRSLNIMTYAVNPQPWRPVPEDLTQA